METITDYDYGISYTLGKANVMADALCRKSFCNNHTTYKAQPLHDDLSYREHPIRVLVQAERRTRQRAFKILKVQWSNPSEDETTWELQDRLRDKYPSFVSFYLLKSRDEISCSGGELWRPDN